MDEVDILVVTAKCHRDTIFGNRCAFGKDTITGNWKITSWF